MPKQLIESGVHKNIGIQINPPPAQKLFQPDDIRAMGKMHYRVPEDLAWGLYSFHGYISA